MEVKIERHEQKPISKLGSMTQTHKEDAKEVCGVLSSGLRHRSMSQSNTYLFKTGFTDNTCTESLKSCHLGRKRGK